MNSEQQPQEEDSLKVIIKEEENKQKIDNLKAYTQTLVNEF